MKKGKNVNPMGVLLGSLIFVALFVAIVMIYAIVKEGF